MDDQLSGHHRKTYEHLFRHPLPHNLQWREVWSMLGAVSGAVAVEDDKGNVKVARNGQTLLLHRPRGKDLADKKELLQVRHFLERSGVPDAPPAADGTRLLVVIDHREARVYRTDSHGSAPERVTPCDPSDYGRDLHAERDDSDGQRKPERRAFYDAVAKTLHGARQILLFGLGTGASSAMEHLLAELKLHHRPLAERVVGSVAVDEHHLTEDQLLAKARALFA